MEQDSTDGVVIKQETVEPVELESRVIELCQETPKGITDALIMRHMPMVTAQQRAMAINRLLSTGRIDVLKGTGGLIYRLKDTQGTNVIKGADNQEKLVYQIITDAGNKGIWIRDIRYRCNIMITQLNKILRNLESKKLIKSVKSVAASKKKVYMLFNLEPDQSVTGGAWFSDQDFESEFVEVLNQQCFKFLQQKATTAKEAKQGPIAQRNASYASSKEVCKFITELGISKVQLSVADIETILNTLIYDGKVEMTVVASQSSSTEDSQTKLFRAVAPIMQPAGLMRIPCGVCPVFDRCHEGGAVSPSTCVYMKDWLEF